MLKHMNRSEPALHLNEIDVSDKYKFLKQIGKGSYGEVWLVIQLKPNSSSTKVANKQYVLKRLDLRQQSNEATQNDMESAEREAKLLSTLKHPNIVAYIESFRSNDHFLNIVMAYCEGGDLYTKLKERKASKDLLPENQIVEWFVQICMALQYMHDKSILHRDLKTQNIFLTKNEIVKVGDLGIARVLDSGNDLATTIIGTPYYMSPEIFSNVPYGQKSDIWALGCCVYEMTTLEHAFNAKDMNSLVLKIIRGQTPQTSKKYSEPLTALIKLMLSKNPDDRPTARKILQNPFIKRHIMQLLEKTKIKCQNQSNSNTATSVNILPPSLPPSATPPLSSSPPRPLSANDAKLPYSSANSPLSKKPPSNRFSHHHNPSALPSYPLPPSSSYQRSSNGITPASSSGSSSSADASRSLPSVDVSQESNPRARRRDRIRQNNLSSVNDIERENPLISKVRGNDTLQRRNRDKRLADHLKQHQQLSSDDEHELLRHPNSSPAIAVLVSSKKLIRASSAASSFESNHSKFSLDDDGNYSSERESHFQSSQTKITHSYDANNSQPNTFARQRRRDSRTQLSIEASSPPTTTSPAYESSQDVQSAEIEKKKEGERDMKDFLFELTATLKLDQLPPNSTQESDIDHNEFTNSSNDSDRTITFNGDSHSPPDHQIAKPWLSTDRTMEAPLQQTNRLYKRFQTVRDECLQEINPDQLHRVLQQLDNLSEIQMKYEMIDILGEYLYQKYAPQIFLLKFYEDNLRKYTEKPIWS